jgi:hypothetical protein
MSGRTGHKIRILMTDSVWSLLRSLGQIWSFSQPFFFVLDLAVGGTCPGSPAPSTKFPARMDISWIAVYQRVLQNSDTHSRGLPSGSARADDVVHGGGQVMWIRFILVVTGPLTRLGVRVGKPRTCPVQKLTLERSDLGELNPRPAPMTFSYRS